jgi:hypothetical protein
VRAVHHTVVARRVLAVLAVLLLAIVGASVPLAIANGSVAVPSAPPIALPDDPVPGSYIVTLRP